MPNGCLSDVGQTGHFSYLVQMKNFSFLSWLCPFIALGLCILGLFAMRLVSSPWMGLAYGAVVFLVLLTGMLTGIVSLFRARKEALERNQILVIMAGTLAGWFLLSFLVFFGGKAYGSL